MAKPTTRVLAVLELLQTHGRMSGTELAQRLEVDVRTVRRYISALEELGIPVTTEQGRYGGYMLVAGFKLPPMMFTDAESQAIALGLLAAGQLGLAEASPAIASVQAKLERVMPANLKGRVRAVSDSIKIILPKPEAARDGRSLRLLTDAVQAQRSVSFSYCAEDGNLTTREFDPYGLVYRHGRWYLCGFCHLRQAMRSFRLDRLEGLQALERHFARPPDFDAADYLLQSLVSAPRAHSLTVILHSDMEAVRRFFGCAEGLLQPSADGVLLQTTTDDFDYFARWLASLPIAFSIIEPQALREALNRHIEQLIGATASAQPPV